MGVSLSYVSAAKVPQEVREQLIASVDDAAGSFTWWAESICLWEHEEKLAGDTKIYLLGYSNESGQYREVDPADDSIMAWRDTVHILKLLQGYSRTHSLVWDIEVAGESFGQIKGDEGDRDVFDKAAEILDVAEIGPDDPSLSKRVADIDAQFRDRWET